MVYQEGIFAFRAHVGREDVECFVWNNLHTQWQQQPVDLQAVGYMRGFMAQPVPPCPIEANLWKSMQFTNAYLHSLNLFRAHNGQNTCNIELANFWKVQRASQVEPSRR